MSLDPFKLRTTRSLLGPAVVLLTTTSWGAPASTSTTTTDQSPPGEAADKTNSRALPLMVAVGPGLVLQGAGHHVLGEPSAARALHFMQLGGLSNFGLSLLLGVTFGANPVTIPFVTLALVSGAGLMVGAYALDVAGMAVPPESRGRPRAETPRLLTRAGYMYVYDPTFSYRHFAVYGFEYTRGRVGVAPEVRVAREDGNLRMRAQGHVKLWRPEPSLSQPDGSYLMLAPALSWQRFFEERFSVATAELSLKLRLDAARVDAALRGTFLEGHAGIGVNQFRYDPRGHHADENALLLAGFGVGMYYGDARHQGGEVMLSFDQRHDDYAAGLKVPRIGSGVIGHFGLNALHYLSEDFGLYANLAAASAYVVDVGLLFRSFD